MRKLKILTGSLALTLGLAGCSSAFYGASSDNLSGMHDRAAIAQRQQVNAEARVIREEARQARMETLLTEDINFSNIVANDFETAYARRLRGMQSGSYRMPSSMMNAQMSREFRFATAFDPAFYNVIVSGDQVWVEPRFVTSMFGTWGATPLRSWHFGWGRSSMWGPSWGFGWNSGWGHPGWGNSWGNPWNPWWGSSWGNPWWGPGWGHPGWGPGWNRPGWGPGWNSPGWGWNQPRNFRDNPGGRPGSTFGTGGGTTTGGRGTEQGGTVIQGGRSGSSAFDTGSGSRGGSSTIDNRGGTGSRGTGTTGTTTGGSRGNQNNNQNSNQNRSFDSGSRGGTSSSSFDSGGSRGGGGSTGGSSAGGGGGSAGGGGGSAGGGGGSAGGGGGSAGGGGGSRGSR